MRVCVCVCMCVSVFIIIGAHCSGKDYIFPSVF